MDLMMRGTPDVTLRCRLLVALAALWLVAFCVADTARAQAILALVNGDPITAFDVEQRIKLVKLADHKAITQKEALEQLVDDRAKLKEAKRYNLDLSASDIDEQYEAMAKRMRLVPEQFNKVLEAQGVRPETLKARIKADFVWSQLVRGRFPQSLLVGENEIKSTMNASGEVKDDSNSFEYTMRPTVLLVTRSAESSTVDTRRKEAEALRARIQSCDEAKEIFRNLHDAVIRDPVQKTSADLPQTLRAVLDTTPIGHLTAPEVTREGVEMVALCDRKPTTVDSPQKREAREKIFARKYAAQSSKYLQEIRRSSMIEYRDAKP
jgi:peptidyl-prolyl cis-trans isomerase SurA